MSKRDTDTNEEEERERDVERGKKRHREIQKGRERRVKRLRKIKERGRSKQKKC